ncbi:hypothetical protein Tco_0262388 [Tanacetum coccineum]
MEKGLQLVEDDVEGVKDGLHQLKSLRQLMVKPLSKEEGVMDQNQVHNLMNMQGITFPAWPNDGTPDDPLGVDEIPMTNT